MAPEVVLNKPYTEKVDVYSFAVVIWTVARNKPPFHGYDRAKHRARGKQSNNHQTKIRRA